MRRNPFLVASVVLFAVGCGKSETPTPAASNTPPKAAPSTGTTPAPESGVTVVEYSARIKPLLDARDTAVKELGETLQGATTTPGATQEQALETVTAAYEKYLAAFTVFATELQKVEPAPEVRKLHDVLLRGNERVMENADAQVGALKSKSLEEFSRLQQEASLVAQEYAKEVESEVNAAGFDWTKFKATNQLEKKA